MCDVVCRLCGVIPRDGYRLECSSCDCGDDAVVYLPPAVASVFVPIVIATIPMTCDGGDVGRCDDTMMTDTKTITMMPVTFLAVGSRCHPYADTLST